MTISIVQAETNWNGLTNLPQTHASVVFDLKPTGNRTIFAFDADCGTNTYTGHLNLVPDMKKFPNVEKFHITVVSCNNKNVKTNYFGDVQNTINGLKVIDANTDGGKKQAKYSSLPNDLKQGLTLLLQNNIFFGAVS